MFIFTVFENHRVVAIHNFKTMKEAWSFKKDLSLVYDWSLTDEKGSFKWGYNEETDGNVNNCNVCSTENGGGYFGQY